MKAIARPGGHRSRRYVFREQDSLHDVMLIARRSAWTMTAHRPADPERNTPLVVKWELFPGQNLSYSEDPGIGASYVMATSILGPEAIEAMTAVFEVHPGIAGIDDLTAAADAADGTPDAGPALARLGLGAPLVTDTRLAQRISDGVRSPDPGVREGALWAVAYTEWPEFRELMHQVAAADDEPFLAEFAAGILGSFDELGLP